jgi:hypothetical protein
MIPATAKHHTTSNHQKQSSMKSNNNQKSNISNDFQQLRLAKNLIDLNLQLPNNAQQQHQINRTASARMLNSQRGNGNSNSNSYSYSNELIMSPNNRFLEEILVTGNTNSTSNNKRPPSALNGANPSTNGNSSLAASGLQLLPATITVINRTNDERSLFPDKLILERFVVYSLLFLFSLEFSVISSLHFNNYLKTNKNMFN